MHFKAFATRLIIHSFIALILLFSQTLNAVQPSPVTWIVNETDILQDKTQRGISQILAEFAQKKHIHLQVFIVDKQSHDNIDTFARHKMNEWETKHTHLQLKKTAYIFMNTQTGQSSIILGKNTQRSQFMQESFNRIQTDIIAPALRQHKVDKAVWESVIGVTAILNEWPAAHQFSWLERIINWLVRQEFNILLKLLIGISLLMGLRFIWVKLFTRPAWIPPTTAEMQAIESQLGY